MKRLLIYFFYDKDGIVDDYIPYLLKHLKLFCQEICFVSNGNILSGKDKITPYINKLIEKENVGFDVGAYKFALYDYGFNKLKEYDEIILCNYTFYGPFYPLDELFRTMDKKICDWWGMFTWSFKLKNSLYPHIPSFWCAYRKSLVSSPVFEKYWQSLPEITSYNMSISEHEQRQTPYFTDAGFHYEVWFSENKYRDNDDDYLWPFKYAKKMIEEDRFPFLKRRTFFIEKGVCPYVFNGVSILSYLKQQQIYPENLIYNNIFRTQKYSRKIIIKQLIQCCKYWLKYKLGISKQKSYRKLNQYSSSLHSIRNLLK